MNSANLPLSASAVHDFLECPYRYALNYVRRLPDAARQPISTLSFGQIVHEVLAEFIRAGGWQRVSRDGIVALLRQSWQAGVYPEPDIDKANFAHAAGILHRFYDAPYPAGIARELGVERRHAWARARRGILAKGRIDRAVQLEDGSIELVDYKCGRLPAEPDALGRDPQALFYRSLGGEAYRRLSPPAIRVTFLYLVPGRPLSVDFDKDDFLEGWRRIEQVADGIRAGLAVQADGAHLHSAFVPRPGGRCRFCPFQHHCQALLEDGVIALGESEASA